MTFNPLQGLQKRQQEILKDIYEGGHKFSVIRASRQAGKTVLLEHILMMFAIQKGKQIGGFIAPSHSQALKVFNSLLSKVPPQIIEHHSKSDSDRYIRLINGTTIQFKSAANYDLIRGNSWDFIVIDEAAFIKEEAWNQAIKQTIAAKRFARVVFASTPLGKNLFYKWCTLGQDPNEKRYRHYYFSYKDNKYYDLEEVEAARRELPDAVFRQEYLAEFLLSNSVVFGDYSAVQTVKTWDVYREGSKYFFGLDWSGGGDDSTVLTIMDQGGKVVLIKEFSDPSLTDKAKRIADIINKYGAIGYSEVNGLGLGATEMLQSQTAGCYKFTTTNDSKQGLVKDLTIALSDQVIQLPVPELCPQLDNEMAIYQVKRSATGKLVYSHPQGFHDDYVDSLMLANTARVKLGSGAGSSFYSMDDLGEFFDISDLEGTGL